MFLYFVCVASFVFAQTPTDTSPKTGIFLERIRGNDAQLKAFFHRMPKGGDLHHHFSGAVYAETFFDTAYHHHFLIDTAALLVYAPSQASFRTPTTVSLDSMSIGKRSYYKDKLIRLWSAKDFEECSGPSDAHFFNTFGLFGSTIAGSEASMLQEIKHRAIAEHTSYIKTMFLRPSMPGSDPKVGQFFAKYNLILRQAASAHDTSRTLLIMSDMLPEIRKDLSGRELAEQHHNRLAGICNAARLPKGEDSLITIRFLNYVTRVSNPADVFAQLYLSFASCDMDSLVMGVNIVAPENADISMNDYWLHMQMFRFFKTKFPMVHTSMHAGELVLGMVKPEDLTWHISSAVYDAFAERIGHGVDIAYEKNNYELLREMARRKVAVEINLTSNEFILKTKGPAHPISLYIANKVPIVISTDDPGVLRSDHSGEFVLLAKRYPNVTYAMIKQFVFNSIEYSFLKPQDKALQRNRLEREFDEFEKTITSLRE